LKGNEKLIRKPKRNEPRRKEWAATKSLVKGRDIAVKTHLHMGKMTKRTQKN